MLKKKIVAIVLASMSLVSLLSGCSLDSSKSSNEISNTQSADSTSKDDSSSSSDDQSKKTGMRGGGEIDKSSDTELQTMISDVEGKFKQFEFTDPDTGKTVSYNLYIPDDYDSSKSYPLVLFIADSSVVGKETTAPLTQGYGGLIWATEEEQAKHESFVLVPEYPETILDDHDGYTMTDYVDMTTRLLDSVTSSYNVDKNRLYATGQSMGCMTLMYLSAQNPDLFAAELFVSGQWDTSTLGNLASQKYFYIAAEGDAKASAGQIDVENMLDNSGIEYSTATWDATWDADKFSSAVESILSEGNNINIVTFKKGTVLPEGTSEGTSEHMYSFDYAYKIEGVRDWLFNQTKE